MYEREDVRAGRPRRSAHVAKFTTINAEPAEIAETYGLCGLSEFCVQRRGCNLERANLTALQPRWSFDTERARRFSRPAETSTP
jgi:hypothetical protein